MRRTLILVGCLVLTGCGAKAVSPAAPEPTDAADTVRVISSVFGDGEPIPTTYTCRGSGFSPPLEWSVIPAEARALALVVDDPDAPSGNYTHWVVVDIPVADTGTTAGAAPTGGVELQGDGGPEWSAPCPPSGTHHYRFHVYALRAPLGLDKDASLDEAMHAIGSHTLAWGELTGTVTAASSGGGGY
jgi:Raf kinase inhibitor-like YbhB/YbcL family protein